MPKHSPLTRKLIADGLAPPTPGRPFAEYPPELQAAVNAYDEARRSASSSYREPPMSEANKATITPMIAAAITAFAAATKRNAA